MRLRQKLFAAILAVMAIMFLMLALVSFMQGLEAQRERQKLEGRLEKVAVRDFHDAVVSEDADRWNILRARLESLGSGRDWLLVHGDETVFLLAARETVGVLEGSALEGDCILRWSRAPAGLESVTWLSGLLWAVPAGTAFLLLVVYGLLLRLVLRPVENLVAASRVLSSGGRPEKVAGDSRTDEIGEFVRAFNRMASEVCASREELRRRVEEAVAEYEKAQKRLVLEQRLSATGRLAAGVAHEINNPLGGMMNAARAIGKERGLSERAREYVALINNGLERVRAIVERMRVFARPKPSVGPVDVTEAVKNALSFARHRVDSEGVALEEDYPDGPARTVGDGGELQQVFLNLVMNALDAMRGSAERRLKVRVAREGEYVLAEISDTGAGMDGEQLAGAFDLFYSTKGEGGTGLGLAIAHRIVSDHGGEVELESSPGRGTTARVRLPAEGGPSPDEVADAP